MNEQSKINYNIWKSEKLKDKELSEELKSISNDEEAINDRFYKELEFGTGGLRGVLGAGTNRINIYTIGKATQGYANYLLSKGSSPSIAIAYDSRINSEKFAHHAACVMAANGIKVYLWKELMPTPSLSFAVRYLGCDGGIVITASHNPSKYNGYKVYASDGCQITTKAADEILELINNVDTFKDVKISDYNESIKNGDINIISDEVFDAFINEVSLQSLAGKDINKNVKIVYTPLYGAGLKCVTTCLKNNGFNNIVIVKEQATPNGNFPTCPYPNPEIREALEVGLKVAKDEGADLLIATDPDCDRVGIAVKDNNEYTLLSGNEVGILLLDYICKRRIELGKMPDKPVCIKTIVTTDMASNVAKDYGVEIIDVLTGFKFIGEQIGLLEAKNETSRYIFGFEESYGYLTGSYVRDKDAVNGSFMIAEMFAYYISKGKSLIEVLDSLYQKYGYCLNTLHSFEFEGESGMKKMNYIMKSLRENVLSEFAGKKIVEVQDYLFSEITDIVSNNKRGINLPKSNVIKYILEGNSSIVLRPSGTEPKLKLYISISAKSKDEARILENKVLYQVEKLF
jgi:hypothetical protein